MIRVMKKLLLCITLLSVAVPTSGKEVILFEWNRSLHDNVTISIQESGDEHKLVVVKGKYSPHEFPVGKDSVFEILEQAKSCGFYELKPKKRGLTIDGATWKIVIHNDASRYEVARYSPKSGCVRKIGEILIGLSRLKVKREDIY